MLYKIICDQEPIWDGIVFKTLLKKKASYIECQIVKSTEKMFKKYPHIKEGYVFAYNFYDLQTRCEIYKVEKPVPIKFKDLIKEEV